MAEEMLRRNLDRAFDPGPDFPNRLLLSRTMAMLDADVVSAGRSKRLERPSIGWLGMSCCHQFRRGSGTRRELSSVISRTFLRVLY